MCPSSGCGRRRWRRYSDLRTHSGSLRSRIAFLALPVALILLGALMRAPVLLAYQGPLTAHALNVDLMAHVGAYSDISHLFFRTTSGSIRCRTSTSVSSTRS